jgi:hypothetical protein
MITKTRASALALALVFAAGAMQTKAYAQTSQAGLFLGQWCAQGDSSKPASVAVNGSYVTLTNEQGATSRAYVQGGGTPVVVSNKWNVRGNLNPSGHAINWSNGTTWSRCFPGAVPTIGGTWHPSTGGGSCTIDQRGQSLYLTNESGTKATGAFTDKTSIVALWNGAAITGSLSKNRQTISWSNGTSWSR